MLVVLIWIVILGAIAWGVRTYAPIPNGFKVLVYVVCLILAIDLVLRLFGINLGAFPSR